MSARAWDYILVGGGLQNGLIALSVLERDPDAKVLLLERDEALGGNHTWSFHLGSIPDEVSRQSWFPALVEHYWPSYRVRFEGLERVVHHAYATCSSARFAEVLTERFGRAPNARLATGCEVTDVGAHEVRCVRDGEVSVETGHLVVDARGPRDGMVGRAGFQKFVGLEVELEPNGDAGGTGPLDLGVCDLMDTTVPQDGGFRFFYVLPFSPTRALIEDTRFTNGPELDEAAMTREVFAYIQRRGWRVREVVRSERGVLPMPWRPAGPVPRVAPLVAGYRGGWFHPATGYSVPVAVRLAAFVANRGPHGLFDRDFDALASEHEQQSRFAYLLNELLFEAADPDSRWKVFRHFYALPDELVLRFYGLTLSASDKRKMFLRKPPPGVNFLKAMRILPAWGLR